MAPIGSASVADTSPDAVLHTDVPPELPGMRITGTVVFPLDVVSVQIDRPRSQRMIEAHEGDTAIVACFFPREGEGGPTTDKEDFLPIGVACRVIHRMKMPNDTMQVVFQGLRRIQLDDVLQQEPYLRFKVSTVEEREPKGASMDGLIYKVMEMVDQLVEAEGGYPPEMVNILRMNIAGAGRFADLVGAHVNLPLTTKRHIVATPNVRERMKLVEEVVGEAIGRLQVREEVAEKVKADLNERQREHLLRAQLQAIRKELGMDADAESEVLELRDQLDERDLPDEVRTAATRELDRLASMQPASAEYHVVRTYVAWILDLPWETPEAKKISLKKARRVLERDHYGLDDVKERILEFLAVQQLKDQPKSPVLCLVGPPGVGKTSLGRSIAEAMDRPFVRFSVGGMRDESEIRGHRRTYVGAMPGKIVQAMKRAKARDPVFVIDEIDKMGSDARGDPSSAMLEVLDPSQNDGFVDHYLDVPFDLSRVFFVATANDLGTIPGPLRDRMEIVTLSGYTRGEKLQIARRHLLPRVLDENGLTSRRLIFTDEGLLCLIDRYTREAGVRELRRQMSRICRHRALDVASGGKGAGKRARYDAARVEEALGPAPFAESTTKLDAAVGVTAGLAWTPVGGDLLYFEANMVPGRGRLRVTGRLGDVMRESAEAALTYVRSLAKDLDIDPDRFERQDVHLHVPAGATPKDGPSAGVTMATCLASLFTGRPARSDLAMTGEITLKGRVLAVGGIKEKVLAAHRSGMRQVCLPAANRKDLHELPDEVREALDIRFTSVARENIDAALLPIFLPNGDETGELGALPAPDAKSPDLLPPAP